MKKIQTTKSETFATLANKLKIKTPEHLKIFHNLHCNENDIIRGEKLMGKEIFLPENPEFYIIDSENSDEGIDFMQTYNENEVNDKQTTTENTENNEVKQESKNEHDGKHFVIQKGTCQCDQGFTFPTIKVTSHKKHYWNSPNADDDYLAVTENDLEFTPTTQPFGQCKLKPTMFGYQPCAYAPAGKWEKTYEKVQVLHNSCVTEISELQCTSGGKITILKHGQQAQVGARNVMKSNSQEQQIINPFVDFEEFKDEVEAINTTEVI